MRVVWSQPALNDLKAIYDYLNDHDPRVAVTTLRAIRAKADLLQQFPAMGPALDRANRQLSVARTPYLIVYQIQSDRVFLLRFFDSRQDWQRQIGDL